jgi:hypothetical protein
MKGTEMSTATIATAAEDHQQAAEAGIVQVSRYAWGIQLPNTTLYREQHAWLLDPDGTQPTVWFQRAGAEAQRELLAITLDLWYGMPLEVLEAVQVVPLEMGPDGQWRLVAPNSVEPQGDGYHPLNMDTEELSVWGCDSTAELTEDQARQVMRDHRECAGLIPCRIRGRARGLLARRGVMVLNCRANAWRGLGMPDKAAR